MRFRKKPVVVEAIRWTGVMKELNEFFGSFTYWELVSGSIAISTLEGVMYANDGDWIIKGVKGEFYPCKPDVFAETYEPVEEP